MMKTLATAAALSFALSGAALAQTTGGGSAEKNLNNPGSVKSNAEKGMPSRDVPTTLGTAPGAATAPAGSTERNLNNPGSVKSDAEKAGR
ncbi:hypothetical protein [Methylobacterium durans]|uniref:Uncharacterized protein n=1 Tax=Methylobacterium durans TaxID=2202825 RepID=A0A2U8WB48_9HYPH|nr:hypothetical protein [Methylobacterium durans]AWN43373.1 hypothetical protein DK389_26260 [Methylobacterium durans]